MTKVTYRPLETGDPMETTFAGFKFHSGEPVDVDDNATVEALNRATKVDSQGETRGKGQEGHRKVLDVLKSNPYFVVDGATPVAKAKPGRPALPKTPSEYRSYALEWFKTSDSVETLTGRWDREASLRDKIGVHEGGEDISYLNPFFERRMDELKRAEAA